MYVEIIFWVYKVKNTLKLTPPVPLLLFNGPTRKLRAPYADATLFPMDSATQEDLRPIFHVMFLKYWLSFIYKKSVLQQGVLKFAISQEVQRLAAFLGPA